MHKFVSAAVLAAAFAAFSVPTIAQVTAPAAMPATAVTETSFTANWSSITGGSGYSLDVSTSMSFATYLSGYNNLGVSGASQTVTGLSSGMAYYYRVRADSASQVSANSNVITIVTLPGFPTPIPSGVIGGKIVYSRAGSPNDTLWIAAGDGSKDSMVTVGGWPRLSHHGRQIAFHRGSDPNKTREDIYVHDLQTGQDTLIFGNNDYAVNFAWSPNDSILYFDYLCGMNYTKFGVSAYTTFFNRGNCWDDAPQVRTSDGMMAFHNYYSGIWLADSNGGNLTLVPNTQALDYWPSWSPNGGWISFGRPALANDYPNVVNYYKIHADGAGLTQLTFLSGADTNKFMPSGAWTSDSAWIVAPGYLGGVYGIFAIATDGSGTIRRLAIPPGAPPDFVGTVTFGSMPTSVREPEQQPSGYALSQNYPNPFNPATNIGFHIAEVSLVTLKVYDILGREVATLVNGVRRPGAYTVSFDGSGLASGVYFYRLQAGRFADTKKLLLLR